MTKIKDASLAGYARRRYALSQAGVSSQFPYCKPIQQLNVTRPGSDDGVVSFAHYDYLAIAQDRRLIDAVHLAIDEQGVGAGASRLVGGELNEHRALERELSEFLGFEDTLTLVSGYGANASLVSHMLTKDDLIIYDEASHNSIIAGTQASRSQIASFRHNDLDHLADILDERRASVSRVMVIVEGLYSMDGDVPDLPALIEVCREYNAWLMIDEAHSIGVLGETGRGICEHFGISPGEVDLIVGTLSKSFAGCGGFISARQPVIDWLRLTLPGFVYSVGMSPPMIATARKALQILRQEPVRVRRLKENSEYFLAAAQAAGLNTGDAIGRAVIPVRFPDNQSALAAANSALEAGIFAPPIVVIAVPKEAPRIRFFITAAHDQASMRRAIDAIAPYSSTGVASLSAGEPQYATDHSP